MQKSNKNILAFSIFGIAVVSRLLPHLPNFTPLEAIALFSGAYLMKGWMRFLLPLIAIYVTDLILNNTILRIYFPEENGIIWFSQYMIWTAVAMVGIVFIGTIISKNIKIKNVILGALSSSILFFVVSNLGVWMGSSIYPKDLSGLTTCFIAALPFFKTSLLSTLAFSGILFFSYEWFARTRLKQEAA